MFSKVINDHSNHLKGKLYTHSLIWHYLKDYWISTFVHFSPSKTRLVRLHKFSWLHISHLNSKLSITTTIKTVIQMHKKKMQPTHMYVKGSKVGWTVSSAWKCTVFKGTKLQSNSSLVLQQNACTRKQTNISIKTSQLSLGLVSIQNKGSTLKPYKFQIVFQCTRMALFSACTIYFMKQNSAPNSRAANHTGINLYITSS